MTLVKDLGTPILGINSGRLGFMANINANDIPEALQKLLTNNYKIEKRGLYSSQPMGALALNEQQHNEFHSTIFTSKLYEHHSNKLCFMHASLLSA